jgi:hypothetical protein
MVIVVRGDIQHEAALRGPSGATTTTSPNWHIRAVRTSSPCTPTPSSFEISIKGLFDITARFFLHKDTKKQAKHKEKDQKISEFVLARTCTRHPQQHAAPPFPTHLATPLGTGSSLHDGERAIASSRTCNCTFAIVQSTQRAASEKPKCRTTQQNMAKHVDKQP